MTKQEGGCVKKYKEFWINKATMTAELPSENILISDPRRQIVHVIEKSAYDELLLDARKLRDRLDWWTATDSCPDIRINAKQFKEFSEEILSFDSKHGDETCGD